MQVGHNNGNISNNAPRKQVQPEPGDRVFYTTAPRVKGVKHMLHEYLRSQNKGHLIRTLQPGEPRRIIMKALSDYPRTPYVRQNRRKPEGGGVSEVCDSTSMFTKTPSAGTSFPGGDLFPSAGKSFPGGDVVPPAVTSFPGCDVVPSAGTSFPGGDVVPSVGTSFPVHDVVTYVKNVLDEPVCHAAPVCTTPIFHKKKRKRKRKRKVKEPLPIQPESKDQKGKNKSTKHIPPPEVTTLSDSSENDQPSTSHLAPSHKPHKPSSDHSSIAETTMGSLTQAIFRGKPNQRVEESNPCIDLSSNSEDLDIFILPTPSPMASYPQNNLSRAADVPKKKSATQALEEILLKRIKKKHRGESQILKEGSCQTRKQYEEVQVVELENHMKKSSDASETPFSKMAEKPIETRTTPAQLHEISSCTEAEVSSLLRDKSKIKQKKRKCKVSKFSLSQWMRKDSSDESEENSETPTTSKVKHKCGSPQKNRLNIDLLNNVSKNICDQESKKINTKVSLEDDMGREKRLPLCSLSCHGSISHGIGENSSGGRNQKQKLEPDYTSVQKKTKTPTSCRMPSELCTVDRDIAFENEKNGVCCLTSVPETSESSVFSSSSSMITETGALENSGIKKTATVYNKVFTEQRGTLVNSPVSGSKLIENDFSCHTNQIKTSKGEKDAPSSNPSISSSVSSISSASTEMLHPVGKTCLHNVVFILRNHFGGTASEVFDVLRRNSFNLLTTIQELQVLYPPCVEVVHCSEVEEESSGG